MAELIIKPCPLAARICCTFSPTTFSSVHGGMVWESDVLPFTEGCAGANNKASPPGRHQEQAPKQRCTFRPITFSSVQFSSWMCGHNHGFPS